MPDIVVIGAGIIGLASATLLQRRGRSVAIWTRDLPEQTTSAVAAAVWYPYLAEPRERVLRWSKATFAELRRQAMAGDVPVRLQPMVEWFRTTVPDLWWAGAVDGLEWLAAHELPPGYLAGIRVAVPVCDTRDYLPWLRQQFERAGGQIVLRELHDLDEARAVARAVVHCSGLGASSLAGDDSVRAVRGQVVLARGVDLPEGLIDDCSADPVYAVPRRGEVVLGGTAQHGDPRLDADPADTARILRDLHARLPVLRAATVHAVRVGLRPFRPTVRLEREQRSDGAITVHNYGHGGSGFTLCWGCAQDVADLIEPAS